MATFGHITPKRCAQLGRALTAAGLTCEENGNQITPSKPSNLWQANCADPYHHSPVLSPRALAAHIRDFPA